VAANADSDNRQELEFFGAPDGVAKKVSVDSGRANPRHAQRTPRRGWVRATVIFGTVLVGLGIIAGIVILGSVFLKQARQAESELTEARKLITQVPKLLDESHREQLLKVVDEAQTRTASALEVVQRPLWDFAAGVPLVGANVSAVQLTAEAVDVLASEALPPGLDLMSTLRPEQLRLEGGGFDLQPLMDAHASLPEINAAFGKALRLVDRIDREHTLPMINDVIGEVVDLIQTAAPALDTVERVLPTVLPMLGSEGPRNYLLTFQNLAEIRATGGNPAATAMIRVDGGHISLDEQADSQTFYQHGTVGVDYSGWPAETLGIYEDDTTWYTQNYTRTPNFPTTARMFSGIWEATTGVPLDGVISLDPVVLSYILAATGPIVADGIELNSDNVVQAVLSDAYARYPNGSDSDVFFADVASQVFDLVSSGQWDPLEMLGALESGVTDQRIFAWFPREAEQALATEFGIDGHLATDNSETTELGVFVNDWTVGKMQYWFSTSVAVTCEPDARTVTTTIDLNNTMPGGDFVKYVLGFRSPDLGLPKTTMLLNVLYFAPPGTSVDSVDVPAGWIGGYDRSGVEEGRAVQSVMVAVPMGETRSVSFTSTLPSTEIGPISLRTTPTVTDTPVSIAPSCDVLTRTVPAA